MILVSLPQNFESISEFLDNNTELGFRNNIFLDYIGSASDMKSSVVLKLSFDSSRININEGLDISLERGLVEINKDKLYFHFAPGFVSQVHSKNCMESYNFLTNIFNISPSTTFWGMKYPHC